MKRVFCLYRVSTKGQVEKDDIPMQKRACEEFCDKMDWQIVDSRSEKGISGYKTSAYDRDAINDIRKAALEKKFDVLLVYMFDRLGRKEDETPFIVQWFIDNGIEVWSTIEGQQQIKQHVDKLLNYIHYWQAAGESEKISTRVKTAQAQMIQDGLFRGGAAPYGYHLVHNGRVNKKGHPVRDIEVNEHEASIVKIIFDRYVNYGYGTQRICTYLAENNIYSRTGGRFINGTIREIIKRPIYIGIMHGCGIQSNIIPELQIITNDIFDRAQEILMERSANYSEQRRIPLITTGKTLLSGNLFCGHCGARLVVTTNNKKYHRKDGRVTKTPRTRYICYNKSRHPEKCDGQTGYTSSKLDRIINEVLKSLFEESKGTTIKLRIHEKLGEITSGLETELIIAKDTFCSYLQLHEQLENELIKVMQGKSVLKADFLNKKHSEVEHLLKEQSESIIFLEHELNNRQEIINKIIKEHNSILAWADIYDDAPIDVKKMIISQIIYTIRVFRDYKIEIDFKINKQPIIIKSEKITEML